MTIILILDGFGPRSVNPKRTQGRHSGKTAEKDDAGLQTARARTRSKERRAEEGFGLHARGRRRTPCS